MNNIIVIIIILWNLRVLRISKRFLKGDPHVKKPLVKKSHNTYNSVINQNPYRHLGLTYEVQ